MQVIEGEKDEKFVEKIIRDLTEKSLDEIVESEEIQAKLKPILEQHWKTVDLIKEKAVYERGVVSFDLTEERIDGYNKFIPYYFYPETTYTVSLTQSAFRTKISVGSNPWSPRPRTAQYRRNLRTIRRRRSRRGRRGFAQTRRTRKGKDILCAKLSKNSNLTIKSLFS